MDATARQTTTRLRWSALDKRLQACVGIGAKEEALCDAQVATHTAKFEAAAAVCANTHMCVQTHTHTHTHIHTHTHTHTNTHTQTHTRTLSHTHTHSHTNTNTHTYTHTYTHTHTPTFEKSHRNVRVAGLLNHDAKSLS